MGRLERLRNPLFGTCTKNDLYIGNTLYGSDGQGGFIKVELQDPIQQLKTVFKVDVVGYTKERGQFLVTPGMLYKLPYRTGSKIIMMENCAFGGYKFGQTFSINNNGMFKDDNGENREPYSEKLLFHIEKF